MFTRWYIIEGHVSNLVIQPALIMIAKSTYEATHFTCNIDNNSISEHIFTTVKIENGDRVKIIFKHNWIFDKNTIYSILNCDNGILHMHPAMGISYWPTLLQCLLSSFLIVFTIPILVLTYISVETLFNDPNIEVIKQHITNMGEFSKNFGLYITIFFTFFIFLFVKGYGTASEQTFRLLCFPRYRLICLNPIFTFSKGIPRFFYSPFAYRENRKSYEGIYDCHKIFAAKPQYLKDVVFKTETDII